MEEKREVSIRNFIKMFVTISYLQEQRFFKFEDIWKYVKRCYECSDEKYCKNISFEELIDEAEKIIADMLQDGTISYVYPDGSWGMYHVNDKVSFIDIIDNSKEYLEDMKKVFLDIHGGEPLLLTLSESNIKK